MKIMPINVSLDSPDCKNVAEATQAAKEMYVKLNQYFHAVIKNSTVFLSTDQEKIQQAIRDFNCG